MFQLETGKSTPNQDPKVHKFKTIKLFQLSMLYKFKRMVPPFEKIS